MEKMEMFVLAKNEKGLILLVICSSLVCFTHCFVSPMTCNVSLTYSCPAWLYYVPETPKTIEETISLFHVNSSLVNRTRDGYLIGVTCSCPADHDVFVWHSHTDYTVQPGDTWERISSKFGSFVVEKLDKTLIAPRNITLDILCGCYESGEVLTYRIVSGDTLFTISSRFKTDLNKIVDLNKLENPGLINAGDVIFIPEPAGIKNLILVDNDDPKARKVSKFPIHMIIGIVVAAVVVVLLLIIIFLWRCYYKRKGTRQSKADMRAMSYLSCNLMSPPSHTKSEESVVSSFNSEKATDFPYNEVRDATSNFSLSLKIGQGSYGSVYLGKLRGNDVAIKQMTNTNSREFLSELNILCKVHHTNLIELIGYAAGGDSLFLVYEFAENGALSDHLHNPAERGYKPLPWTTRVQIALDAAKGLEYIHMHTKPYYVHRDVKTSNILLDSNFRAKVSVHPTNVFELLEAGDIADFGLVKLIEQAPDVRTAASRIVGTFGYLAPEYVRDGCVTTKSDVYGFGVVLMELLTGQPALSRDASPSNAQYYEHRSLVDYMLSVLENEDPLTKLTQCIGPTLFNYDKDSLLQMALLSKDCVDDDWNRRPDMSKVVLRLSHILVCSEKCEKQSPENRLQ